MVQSRKPFVLDDSHPMDIMRMTGKAGFMQFWADSGGCNQPDDRRPNIGFCFQEAQGGDQRN